MHLTPQERDRLLIATAAGVARARQARGLALNVPETIAVVADTATEAARDGVRLAEAVARAQAVLGPDDVLPGVADVVSEVRVEAVFADGTRLVVVPDPIRGGSIGAAAPGAVLPSTAEPGPSAGDPEAPDAVRLTVENTAAVPISVTSHWHFFEANPRLRFDRGAAYGRRLAVPAGATVRFDPGRSIDVTLVPIGGARVAVGFAGLVDGALDDPEVRREAIRRVAEFGYLTTGSENASDGSES